MSNNLLICINSRDGRVATATGECPGLVFVGMGFGGCYLLGIRHFRTVAFVLRVGLPAFRGD